MLARFARSGSQSHPPLKNPRSANKRQVKTGGGLTVAQCLRPTPTLIMALKWCKIFLSQIYRSSTLRHVRTAGFLEVEIPCCGLKLRKSWLQFKKTRSSAIAEGPRDASCQLKSCQLPRNSAETTYTTSPGMVWSWRFSRRQCVIDNVHSTMTRSSRLPLSQVS